MGGKSWPGLLAGTAIGALAAAGWHLYRRRPLARVTTGEEIDDPGVAHAYDRIMRLPQMALARRLIAAHAVALMPAGAAADLGCGPGLLAVELARSAPGLHVTGVDLSEPMLSQAVRHASRAGVAGQTDFRAGNAAHTPFADASLDLVVSTLSLHHWSDPVAVLDEIARILRPGGAFLIIDLRRDVGPVPWLFIWFVTRCIVPRALRGIGEPLGSLSAAYTQAEANALSRATRLTGWRVASGPFWLSIEGHTAPDGR